MRWEWSVWSVRGPPQRMCHHRLLIEKKRRQQITFVLVHTWYTIRLREKATVGNRPCAASLGLYIPVPIDHVLSTYFTKFVFSVILFHLVSVYPSPVLGLENWYILIYLYVYLYTYILIYLLIISRVGCSLFVFTCIPDQCGTCLAILEGLHVGR